MNSLGTDILGKCDLHFMRCVKSNSNKAPLVMEDEVVYNKISYLGVLDTIKLKKLGYPSKLTYQNIKKRFSWLFNREENMQEEQIKTNIKEVLT